MVHHRLFAKNLFSQVVSKSQSNENVAISPTSLLAVLAMSVVGAQEKTFEEFAEAFGEKGITRDELLTQIEQMVAVFEQDVQGGLISLAYNTFFNNQAQILPQFEADIKRLFHSEITKNPALFSNVAASADIINTWVSEATKGNVTGLIHPSQLTPLTMLVLANAIYFKGSWLSMFEKSNTNLQAPFQATFN